MGLGVFRVHTDGAQGTMAPRRCAPPRTWLVPGSSPPVIAVVLLHSCRVQDHPATASQPTVKQAKPRGDDVGEGHLVTFPRSRRAPHLTEGSAVGQPGTVAPRDVAALRGISSAPDPAGKQQGRDEGTCSACREGCRSSRRPSRWRPEDERMYWRAETHAARFGARPTSREARAAAGRDGDDLSRAPAPACRGGCRPWTVGGRRCRRWRRRFSSGRGAWRRLQLAELGARRASGRRRRRGRRCRCGGPARATSPICAPPRCASALDVATRLASVRRPWRSRGRRPRGSPRRFPAGVRAVARSPGELLDEARGIYIACGRARPTRGWVKVSGSRGEHADVGEGEGRWFCPTAGTQGALRHERALAEEPRRRA